MRMHVLICLKCLLASVCICVTVCVCVFAWISMIVSFVACVTLVYIKCVSDLWANLSCPASLSLSVFPRSLCAEGRRLSLNLLVQVQCIENPFSAAVTAILFHWIKWGQSSKSKDYTGVYKERDDTNILTHANTPADNVNNVFSCYVNSEVNKCGCSETVTLLCSV